MGSRYDAHVYTNDKAGLTEALGREHAHRSAIEPASGLQPAAPTMTMSSLVFEGPDAPTHTVRWPVIGRSAWVTDMDDFAFPVFCGRYALSEEFQKVDSFRHRRPKAFSTILRNRIEMMVTAYAHPSCRAVFFRTATELARVTRWVDALSLGRVGAELLQKSSVMYPAVPALALDAVRDKWSKAGGCEVVFCGRHYERKNGALALRVLDRLSIAYPTVRCTYIGNVPDSVRAAYEGASDRLSIMTGASRGDVCHVLRRAHVLFHPSPAERFGIIFAEAAANGLAVVTGSGDGMEHIGEIFVAGAGAVTVDRSRPLSANEEDAFFAALTAIIGESGRARDFGMSNHRRATVGPMSIASRDRVLTRAYRSMNNGPHAASLSLEDLPPVHQHITSIGTEELMHAMRQYTGADVPYADFSIEI